MPGIPHMCAPSISNCVFVYFTVQYCIWYRIFASSLGCLETSIKAVVYIADCVSWVPRLTLLHVMNKLDLQMLSQTETCLYVGDLLYRYVAKFWSSPDDIHLLKKIDNNFSLLIQRDDPLTSA